jgi:hypothetical protein
MACDICWALPQPLKKHSYLVTLIDAQTGKLGRCVVQSECQHGMQEWIQHLADQGSLHVVSEKAEKFFMANPTVVHVDAKAAAHLALVDPDPVN